MRALIICSVMLAACFHSTDYPAPWHSPAPSGAGGRFLALVTYESRECAVLGGRIVSAPTILAAGGSTACSMLNRETVQVGSKGGVKGICSNNRMPVSCILIEGFGIECDGPSGGYTGYDLDELIFSACGCTIEEERERLLKREFERK